VSALPAECDVLVAGSGIAGMAAAVEAAELGCSVVVVDAYDEPGGASAIGGAGCCIVDTPLQRQRGIEDSVEVAFADWQRWGGPEADLEWARRYLADSCRDVYDWCVGLGVAWDQINPHEGNSVPRWHRPVGGGMAIMDAVNARAAALGVECVLSARVTELRKEGQVVVEVGATGHTVRGRATVLATGGFTSNQAMLREHVPQLRQLRRFLCGGAPQAFGTGHELLASIGANFRCLDKVWTYAEGSPNPRDRKGERGVVVRGARGAKTEIWVNEQGCRFHDERRVGTCSSVPAMLGQPGQHAWAIFDQRSADAIRLLDDPYYGLPQKRNDERMAEFYNSSPYVFRGDSVQRAAALAGLPQDAVQAEVDAFNRAVESGSGVDPLFGGDLKGFRTIAEPPFYAVEYMPIVQKTLGGVETDLECRVIAQGGPISGLYAAGELAGMAGGHINGAACLEGTMFGPCLYSGRIAGQAAGRFVRQQAC
jgi:predicted oxidoreductase